MGIFKFFLRDLMLEWMLVTHADPSQEEYNPPFLVAIEHIVL